MIARNKYLNLLINSMGNGFPKVITGIRRCGKSYLLGVLFKSYLLEHGVGEDQIVEIDLTKISNAYFRDPIYLYEHVKALSENGGIHYVLLDEIQEVFPLLNPALAGGKHIRAKKSDLETVGFVDVILDLASSKNIDLYVTGSNSKMLSSDVATEFRDKATNIRMQPLSFEEFYQCKESQDCNRAMQEFATYGGMPLAVLKEGAEKEDYLKGLFETTYLKDILDRNKFQKREALDEMCTLLAASVGDLINSQKLADLYKAKTKNRIDPDTVNSYIGAFLDSFLLREAFRYDLKGKKVIASTRKYYYIDPGLRNARLNFVYQDQGKMLENVVYNELIYCGYEVSVGTFESFGKNEGGKTIRKNLEIDFLAVKGTRMYYIQVCDNYSDAKTRSREIKPYIALNDQIQKIVVINSPLRETRDEEGFTIIGACDFLLRFIK